MKTSLKLAATLLVSILAATLTSTAPANENATIVNRSPYRAAFFLHFSGAPESRMIELQPGQRYPVTGPDGATLTIRWNARHHQGGFDERTSKLPTFQVPAHHPGKMYSFYDQQDGALQLYQD